LTKDVINDARDGRGGVDDNTVFRNVFLRLMQSYTEFPFFWFPPQSSGSSRHRSSSRRFIVSRSISRTKTPSNISMNF